MTTQKITEKIILLIRKNKKEEKINPMVLEERVEDILNDITNEIYQRVVKKINKTE